MDNQVKGYLGNGLGVLSTGTSVPLELGCIIFLVCGCAHSPGSSLNPILLGFYGSFLM